MVSVVEIEWLRRYSAAFRPRRTDDLKPGLADQIGRHHVWTAGWLIDDEPYEGQWAMTTDPGSDFPYAWVPQEDLEDLTEWNPSPFTASCPYCRQLLTRGDESALMCLAPGETAVSDPHQCAAFGEPALLRST